MTRIFVESTLPRLKLTTPFKERKSGNGCDLATCGRFAIMECEPKMDFRRLKAFIGALFLHEPHEIPRMPATLEFTVPTLHPGELGMDLMRAFARGFLVRVWPSDIAPILEYLARLERWDDYVELDDRNLLPAERSIVVQELARRLNIPMTERQAARFTAYEQVKEHHRGGIEWFRLAQLDPDLKPIYDAHFMYRSTDAADFSRLCDQLVAEYEA